jgi:hypothetical protein
MQVPADSFNWWTDVAVPLGAALVGGAAAILGGLRAARYESRQTRSLAIELRAQEREEEGLLQLGAILGDIETRMDGFHRDFMSDPTRASKTQRAAEAHADRTRLFNTWGTDLSLRIRDDGVTRAVVDLLNELGYVAGGGTTDQTELQRLLDAGVALRREMRRVLERSA